MRFLFLIICLSSFVSAKNSEKKIQTGPGGIQIVSADKLSYQANNSVLSGNVIIKVGKYQIKAPKLIVINDKNGEPSLANFSGPAQLSSEGLLVTAPEMQMDFDKSLFKCFASSNEDVVSIFESKDKNTARVESGYQELNIATGFAKASREGGKVKFKSSDLLIDSNSIEIASQERKMIYVNFLGSVNAVENELRSESKELIYFPEQDLLKAIEDVKILYLKDKEPSYLFADLVVYERKLAVIGAYQNTKASEIHREKAFGKARQILLTLDENRKPKLAILTGNAFAQYDSKALDGHEIFFDLQNHKIESLVKRPKTKIFKKS